jgi:7,8-dihydropterin-6-yl-methyl-4-(beta-D-ribofuranosyl)aminobenzene 5'-phosphate synthase
MAVIDLTVVFDNATGDGPAVPGLTPLWGFAAMLRLPAANVLFDTGSNGRILLKNMAALHIDPAEIDLVFLSHMHWDHIGGLDSILELNPEATVVVHAGFSPRLLVDLERLCGRLVVVGDDAESIGHGLYSTGRMAGEPAEHALIVEIIDAAGEPASALVAGCAHPGIEQLVARAGAALGRPMDLAIGGFHLFDADRAAIDACVAGLRAQRVRRVLPTHCTGEPARAALRSAWGEGFLAGGIGWRLPLSTGD